LNNKLIEPHNVREIWFYVKPKLEVILKKSPENWIPEDIYSECVNGRSMLWIGFLADKPFGFIVGQIQETNILHIWCGYCDNNVSDKVKWTVVENIAKDLKVKKISFESWRKGWEKKAKSLGFAPRKYIKEIS